MILGVTTRQWKLRSRGVQLATAIEDWVATWQRPGVRSAAGHAPGVAEAAPPPSATAWVRSTASKKAKRTSDTPDSATPLTPVTTGFFVMRACDLVGVLLPLYTCTPTKLVQRQCTWLVHSWLTTLAPPFVQIGVDRCADRCRQVQAGAERCPLSTPIFTSGRFRIQVRLRATR